MGSCAAPSAKGDDKFITTDYLQQCLPVHLNGRYAIMHNKFMVIDGKNVQTGSFNYTASAVSRNAENVLLIEDAPQLAETYQREFNRLWDEGTPLNALY
ncbi:phospholipase D-like domain-containing protein [Klebsiella pneumoniae]|uniref:phospholipase D-like domain-containing protein n=1 Tax=Klebsiella pneumoniae TaxID=573 RepID=UPI003F68A895